MNAILNSAIFQLAAAGIKAPKVWKGGKHYRISWEHKGDYRTLTVPLTPGDHRSALNNAAQLKRILRKDGLIQERLVVRGPIVEQGSCVTNQEMRMQLNQRLDNAVSMPVTIVTPPETLRRIDALESDMVAMLDLLLEMQRKLDKPEVVKPAKNTKPRLWEQKQAKRRLKKIFAT